MWRTISAAAAKKLYQSESIYRLYDDDSIALIEKANQIDGKGIYALEIGHISFLPWDVLGEMALYLKTIVRNAIVEKLGAGEHTISVMGCSYKINIIPKSHDKVYFWRFGQWVPIDGAELGGFFDNNGYDGLELTSYPNLIELIRYLNNN